MKKKASPKTASLPSSITSDQVSGLNTQLATFAPLDSPTFTTIVNLPRIVGSGTAPTVTTGPGAGTGTGLSVTVAGRDLSGMITVTTGATAVSTAASATIVTLAFNSPASGAPNYIDITPGNAITASLYGPSAPWASATSGTGFSISSNTTALGTAVTYKFFYHVIW